MPDSAVGFATRDELLTRQFYAWELRGRGWHVWTEPVQLEPPFRPFWGHYLTSQLVVEYDDGRKPTMLSSWSDTVGALLGKRKSVSSAGLPDTDDDEPEPESLDDDGPLFELQISLPAQTKITNDVAEQFLVGLGALSRPASFEVVGTANVIIIQIACGGNDLPQVRQQLHAYFPDAAVVQQASALGTTFPVTESGETAIVEFGLSNEFMRPIGSIDRFEPDPLAGVIGAMSDLADREAAIFQVLFTPARFPWPENIIRAVTTNCGEPFFADDPDMTALAGRKIARPLFAAAVRVAAHARDAHRAWKLAERLSSSLRPYADPLSNEFIPLRSDHEPADHVVDLVRRRSRRSGMLLNSDELVSLAHLPSAFVRSEKLKRDSTKSKAAPVAAHGHQTILGRNLHAGHSTEVTVGEEARLRHTYVIGASGTGKSTLLLNLIVHDIRQGHGVAVLDPHGDLVDQVMGLIPEDRVGDVVLIDPADTEYPIGFNILAAHSDLERNLLASDLISVFRRLSTSWGDQMNTVFGNAILAFLESSESGTLSDLRKFLVEPAFRHRFLETVRDPEIVYYWQKEFPLLTGKPQGPILTRLDTFLRPKMIRNMVSQKENRLDFASIMNGRKILLAKLSQGLIGEENSYLLGTLIVSKINQMAMSRQDIQASARTPFYLYIDEFHNFVTPSLAAILSGARKYRLGLTLAHQELHQLWSRDSAVASAVISNPYTRICFRLGDLDAKKLAEGFSFFDAKDLQNLGVGEAICRMERADWDFNLATVPGEPVNPTVAAQLRDKILQNSREKYARHHKGSPESGETKKVSITPQHNSLAIPAEFFVPDTVAPPKIKAAAPLTKKTPSAGRGGAQHKYLQDLIRRWGENKGYRVTIEKPILGGLGSVDVVLEKGEDIIACEISITTPAEHELGNLQKCLSAGFGCVIALATEKKVLTNIAKAAECLGATDRERLQFLLPEELFAFLEQRDRGMVPEEKTVRGYNVRVKLNPATVDEQKIKKQVIAQTILSAMRRLKEQD